MTMIKMFYLFALIPFSIVCGYLIGQQTNVAVIAQKPSAKITKNFDLLRKIKEGKIKEIKVLDGEENNFYCVIREIHEPITKDFMFETGEKLNIYDESGKSIYEYKDSEVRNIHSARFLKPDSHQIIFETNGGGTDNFLKIIEYKDGKFTEVIDESETQMRGGYFTMPQYRTGNKTAYFNPEQLIIIQQTGGAEENPLATVFRTTNNKFQNVGSFSMRDLGDLIESQIGNKKPVAK